MSECEILDANGIIRGTCGVDDLLRILADSARRDVVSALDAHERNWIVVEDLVELVSARSTGLSRSEVEAALHHVHLPILDEAGLLEYDECSETIRYYQCALIARILNAVEPDRTRVE
jgi:DNA-binding transcriptional ArsR family regulator